MKRRPIVSLSIVFLLLAILAPLSAESPKMKEALQPFIDNGDIPGIVSILLTKDGIIQTDCLGYADIEKKIPIAADQYLWIASTTKFFTSTALMMLVDEGKVSLDDPIEKYLPEMKDNLKVALVDQKKLLVLQSPKTKPTIRHALSHQVGWAFQTDMMIDHGSDTLPLRQEVFEASLTPLNFQPGTDYSYSELGMDVAGAIIEIVSGMPYEQFMQERIFDPLGMKDTTFWPSKEVQENRWIHYYTWEDNKLTESQIPMMTPPYECKTTRFPEPGAGLFSTANDLAKFFQMHAGGGVYNGKRFISEEAIQEMKKKQTPEGIADYGLGSLSSPDHWYGHPGALQNNCFASTKGVARIFIVQISGLPKSGEVAETWLKDSEEILKDEEFLK